MNSGASRAALQNCGQYVNYSTVRWTAVNKAYYRMLYSVVRVENGWVEKTVENFIFEEG